MSCTISVLRNTNKSLTAAVSSSDRRPLEDDGSDAARAAREAVLCFSFLRSCQTDLPRLLFEAAAAAVSVVVVGGFTLSA
jgi:hypothetical protein